VLAASTEWHSRLYNKARTIEVLQKPLLRLCAGGLVTVKTDASGEIQLRLCSNQATLQRRDAHKVLSEAKRAKNAALVYSRISQTDFHTGEVSGSPRHRKFTDPAKHKIREAGGVLDFVYGLNVWFITLTLPGDTPAAIQAMALYDKEIKNAYLQNFRKLYRKLYPSGGPGLDYLCVSEMQSRGAIHFHIALGWVSERFARIIKRCYRRWWYKILLHYSSIANVNLALAQDGTDLMQKSNEWLVECEQVEKSVGQYLSKYLSKDASKLADGRVNSPSRWWSISVPLREKLMAMRDSETTEFRTYEDAQGQINQAAEVLRGAGYEIKESRSKWCDAFLGYVIFPDKDKRVNLFDWAKLLCTTRGDKYWNERTSVYAFDELFEESS
jgi:hypothetical protein